ncbi:GDP-D-mannose dehydratase [Fasciolopsis buskii]|uniref:GDP-D-mannose dehydratase n=1 Tax=Fasciolopsis buskii TaxID=27845 RepID=A0A8E0RW34_9TREM|nr:GDP-D-mannose dehydratase [Fasciolopsis buski]
MWLMLQQNTPEDFVIASGEKHSVREFTNLAFAHVGIQLRWEGTGLNEVGIDSATGVVRVRVSERYFRPAEVVSHFYQLFFVCHSFFSWPQFFRYKNGYTISFCLILLSLQLLFRC